jgi:hypothetical protein
MQPVIIPITRMIGQPCPAASATATPAGTATARAQASSHRSVRVAAFQPVRGEEDRDGCHGRHGKHGRVGDPEHLAVQDHVAHRAAADGGQAGDEDEADDIQLRPAGGQRAGQRKDRDRGIVEPDREGRGRSCRPWLEGRHAGPGQFVGAFVFGMARVALDPAPGHVVAGLRRLKPLPKLDILDGRAAGGAPALALPGGSIR